MAKDGIRFVNAFYTDISMAALKTYSSALLSAPQSTLLYRTYAADQFSRPDSQYGTSDGQWCPYLIRIIRGRTACVNILAFSPDNSRIASGSIHWRDTTIRIWDAAFGAPLATLNTAAYGSSLGFTFVDNSRILAVHGKGSVQLWDVTSKTPLSHSIKGLDRHNINCVAFSPDKSRIAAGYAKTIGLWDASSGEFFVALKGHSGAVQSVAYSPDNCRVVSGSLDTTIRIWDANSGDLQAKLEGHASYVQSVAFSSDGSRIVSGSFYGAVLVWDAHSGTLQTTLQHNAPVKHVAFFPDNYQIVSGSEKGVFMWDSIDQTQRPKWFEKSGLVSSIAFSPDNLRIISGHDGGEIRVWDATMKFS
jgi:eukaryotic-like serine/threonine-protein kinase